MKPCFIRDYSCPSWAQISLVFREPSGWQHKRSACKIRVDSCHLWALNKLRETPFAGIKGSSSLISLSSVEGKRFV